MEGYDPKGVDKKWQRSKANLADADERKAVEVLTEELEKPLLRIVSILKPDFEAGTYSTIIGDDTSGRIPTLILAKVIQRIYEKKGFSHPTVRFLAGSRDLHMEDGSVQSGKKRDLSEAVARIKETVSKTTEVKKVLVVTEMIETGESIGSLIDALHQNDWTADVATIGGKPFPTDEWEREGYKDSLIDLSNKWNTRIIRGRELPPLIYHAKDFSGVRKNIAEVYATPNPESDLDVVKYVRECVDIIAAKLSTQYEAGHLINDKKYLSRGTYDPDRE
jgi:hypoxanthine phosphoribosyltransferase